MKRDPRAHAGFTFVDLTVVLVLILVLAGLVLLPIFGTRRCGHGRSMQNNTQLRGIHQSMIMYAQGNRSYYPGLTEEGKDGDLSVENRLEILLKGNYFTGEYAVSPHEVKTAWTTGRLTTVQYSYALLQVPAEGQRRAEWRETLNTEAPAASDRNLGTVAAPYSIHAPGPTTGWRGSVAYNDNHVVFESTHAVETKYGTAAAITADHLFDAPTADDALFIHSGN